MGSARAGPTPAWTDDADAAAATLATPPPTATADAPADTTPPEFVRAVTQLPEGKKKLDKILPELTKPKSQLGKTWRRTNST